MGVAEPQFGISLGRYRIIQRLGAGGMAEVFLAHDPRLGRDVAIKVLGERLVNRPGYRAYLQREARAVARLNHPNIAQVYDVIEFRERVCFVQEFVKGQSLADRLRTGPLALELFFPLAGQMAAAIGHAHAQGVLHCDLKPANVLVADTGHAKVVDFGLARPLAAALDSGDEGMGASPTLIENGAGTPAYMSPEQYGRRPLDARSDIYSLGLIMAEMITGQRPAAVLATPATPSSDVTREWSPVSADVPDIVRPILNRALALDPADRYQSAVELQAALETAWRCVTTPASAGTRQPRSDRLDNLRAPTARDRPAAVARLAVAWLLGAALGAGATLVLGLINSSWFDVVLARQGFATESAADWFRWGAKSLVAPGTLAAIAITVLATLRPIMAFAARRGFPTLTTRLTAVGHRLRLNEPGVLARLVAVAGLVALILIVARFAPLIEAFATPDVSVADPGTFSRLGQQYYLEHRHYRQALTLVVVAMGVLLAVAWRARIRQHRGDDRGAFAAALAVLGLALALLDIPYRLLYHGDDFVRLRLGSLECYQLGERDEDILAYCPASAVPRNRTLSKHDPRIERLGCSGNVFDEVRPCASQP